MIPYGRQTVSEEDIQAVVSVLQSDWLTQGPTVANFERELAHRCGARHAVAVNSATSALHVACMALGVGKGDLVWTSPNTFVASANCARYCGADVDFVDIDPRTYNMSVDRLSEKLLAAARNERLPKVVVPVAFTGQSCAMKEIRELSGRYGFRVLEDASHAVGGRYLGEPIGCGNYADISVLSFHPVKVITTAEGGAAVTANARLASSMARLRSHGIVRDEDLMSGAPEGPWYYQQIELGYNYRMTDVHASLGLSQLRRLDAFVTKRHQLAARYDELLVDLPVVRPWRDPDAYSAFHLYVILVAPSLVPARRRIFERLRAAGIGVNVHYIPVHLQPYYRALGFGPGLCPVAEDYYSRAITLPLYPTLTDSEQEQVVEALDVALREEDV